MIVGSLGTKGGRENFCMVLTVLGKRDIDFRRADMANMNGEEEKKDTIRKGRLDRFDLCLTVLSSHRTHSTDVRSCRKRRKHFSLCPLCEFNDVIYDDRGGNV